MTRLTLAIDSSNLSVGGGFTYLTQFLRRLPSQQSFSRVLVFGRPGIQEMFPEAEGVEFHEQPALAGNQWRSGKLSSYPGYLWHLFRVLWWRSRVLPRLLDRTKADVLFAPGCLLPSRLPPGVAGVVMCSNMLPFDRREQRRFGWGLLRLKFGALRFAQLRTLRRADRLLFISEHARTTIQAAHGPFRGETTVIPHGVNELYRFPLRDRKAVASPIKILYVSPVAEWKHQWCVVDAVAKLRSEGSDIDLELLGWVQHSCAARLDAAIVSGGVSKRVHVRGPVPASEVARHLRDADIFVFASTCENCPNSLLEAMAAGLPIACSDRAPMPEFARDGVEYFNAEQPSSIADALKRLLDDPKRRQTLAKRAFELSALHDWQVSVSRAYSFIAGACHKREWRH